MEDTSREPWSGVQMDFPSKYHFSPLSLFCSEIVTKGLSVEMLTGAGITLSSYLHPLRNTSKHLTLHTFHPVLLSSASQNPKLSISWENQQVHHQPALKNFVMALQGKKPWPGTHFTLRKIPLGVIKTMRIRRPFKGMARWKIILHEARWKAVEIMRMRGLVELGMLLMWREWASEVRWPLHSKWRFPLTPTPWRLLVLVVPRGFKLVVPRRVGLVVPRCLSLIVPALISLFIPHSFMVVIPWRTVRWSLAVKRSLVIRLQKQKKLHFKVSVACQQRAEVKRSFQTCSEQLQLQREDRKMPNCY